MLPAVRRTEFVSRRLAYIMLSGCWYHAIVLNAHALKENKIDDVKDSLYEELECIAGILLLNLTNSTRQYEVHCILASCC
jgi:hypothetical protein